jgi:hypothetical protein
MGVNPGEHGLATGVVAPAEDAPNMLCHVEKPVARAPRLQTVCDCGYPNAGGRNPRRQHQTIVSAEPSTNEGARRLNRDYYAL